MKVKDVIKLLKEHHKPNEDLIIAYWQRDAFPDILKKDWSNFSDGATDEVDWSSAHESISYYYDMWKR